MKTAHSHPVLMPVHLKINASYMVWFFLGV